MEPEGSLPHSSARHLSLSWASSIQSIPPHPTSWRSILILSSHLQLGLPSGLFPPDFPTKTLYTPFPHTRYMPRPPHFSRFITRTILGEEYRTIRSSLCSFLHSAVTLVPHILLNTLFYRTLSLRSSLTVSDQSSEILIRCQIRSAHYRLPETERTYLCSKIWLIETRLEFQFQYRSRDLRDARSGIVPLISFELLLRLPRLADKQ